MVNTTAACDTTAGDEVAVTMPTARPSFTTRSSISVRSWSFTEPSDLVRECRVRAEQELLTGLARA